MTNAQVALGSAYSRLSTDCTDFLINNSLNQDYNFVRNHCESPAGVFAESHAHILTSMMMMISRSHMRAMQPLLAAVEDEV